MTTPQPCLHCGEIPKIDGKFTQIKKSRFTNLRILHCCSKSPVWIDLEAHISQHSTLTEDDLRQQLASKWNAISTPNT